MEKRKRILSALIIVILLYSGTALAVADKSSASSPIDSEAMTILTKMADFISKSKSFSVTVESGYDVVQDDGQKIEFGSIGEILVDRPSHMRDEIEQRDGTQAEFIFDGKTISIFNAKENVYGSVEKAGTIDAAMDYFTEDLGMRLPLSQLYSEELPKYLKESVRILDYVDMGKIDGTACDHLAGRMDNVDFQVWIEQGDKPLLRRVVITYKNAVGQPQYWAQLKDWNFSPKVTDSLFTFTPPKGAERIEFVAIMQGEKKGE